MPVPDNITSEEVTLELVESKCIPVLLYGLEACPLNKIHTQSLDFVINRLFMKLFNTSDIALVKQCQEQFNFTLPNVAFERVRTKFMHKLCFVDFCTWSLHCHCIFSIVFCSTTIFVVCYYYMWWIKIFTCPLFMDFTSRLFNIGRSSALRWMFIRGHINARRSRIFFWPLSIIAQFHFMRAVEASMHALAKRSCYLKSATLTTTTTTSYRVQGFCYRTVVFILRRFVKLTSLT